ncbi:MAG: DUF2723 domain-containing protein [Deltaproteobacteria bacterium]|jgi:tetratricopeptide (TPR) repeat protein|nr:DUF2723 domain-containing protein [Deltaproteobacteria bacterium]
MIKNTLKELISVNYLLGIFSLACVFFYVICATPGYGWRDGPELAVTAVFLDVAHPSGFPLYNLLAKILTWLPLGALAYRVTLFTALTGGAAVFLLGLALKRLHGLDQAEPKYFFLLAPLLFFAFHQGIFAAATEVEVYSLNVALIIALLLCAIKWREGHGLAWLYGGGFLYGLSCGNHASLALYLPVLLLLTFWTRPENMERDNARARLIRLSLLALFFLVGLSIYLFLLIRSQTDRLPVDFGRTNTWVRLWRHISDAKDSDYHFKGVLNYKELFYFLKIQFQNLSSPLIWLALPFFLWGLRFLWLYYQILSVALVVLIGINSFFFYYWIDGSAAFLPTVICFFLLTSLGLGQFGRYLAKYGLASKIGFTALIFFILAGVYLILPQRYREADFDAGFMATELFWPDMANLPPEAIAIHRAQWFSELALHHLYVARPDVALIWHASLVNPHFFSPLVPAKNPRLLYPTLADGSLLPPNTPNFFSYFIFLNMEAGKPVYLQYNDETAELLPYMTPEEPFMWMGRLTLDKWMVDKLIKNGSYATYLKWFRGYIAQLAGGYDPPLAKKAPAYLMYISSPIFRLMTEKNEIKEGILTVETLLTTFSKPDGTFLFPHDVTLNLHAFLANMYRKEKKYSKAIEYAHKLNTLSPFNAYNYYILGLIYDNQAMPTETLAAWRKATEIDKYEISFFYNYSLALAKYKSFDEAISFLTERAKTFDEEKMGNLRDLALKFRDCFLLPPEEIGELPTREDLL